MQTKYIILSWNPPIHGEFYQIRNYTLEQKTETSDNFIVIQTLPYSRTRTTIEDLEPSTEYSIRVSSNNKYGRSDGVLITQSTLPGKCYIYGKRCRLVSAILLHVYVSKMCINKTHLLFTSSVQQTDYQNWFAIRTAP